MIRDIHASRQKTARVAGATGLLTMAIVVVAHYGIQYRLFVPGDAAATAQNILAHEALFRANIALDLLYGAGSVVLLTALYALLEPVHRSLALLGAFFRLVYAVMWVITGGSLFFVLRILHGAPYLGVLSTDQQQALARLYLGLGFESYYVGLPFYALAATVCFTLLYKSGYIPRALAAFGVIGSAWCVVSAFAYILIPHFGKAVDPYWFDSPMGIAEMATSLWFLVKGVRPAGIAEPLQAHAGAA